jgi:hypothetical protein
VLIALLRHTAAVNPDPQHRPARRRAGLIAGIAGLLVAATAVVAYAATRTDSAPVARQSPTSEATAPPSPTASPSPVALSTSPAAKVNDEAASDACSQAYKAQGQDSYDPKKMRVVGMRAAESAVPSVRIQGERIVELADYAAKHADELASTLNLSTAVTALATYCLNNRLFNP